jgi:glucose-1-phosphate cytidylyltransferase
MQVVILAGGLGTRLSEETSIKPKPMVEVGGKPILWHIMKLYSHHGYKNFIICLGYKGYIIKEWFANYVLHNSNITVDTRTGDQITIHNTSTEDWSVTLVDTGADTMTGGRIKRVAPYIQGDNFMMTYGDGVSDVDIPALVKFHEEHGKLATIAAVQPEGRFGKLGLDGNRVHTFSEKKDNNDMWINGGFMVLNKKVIDYISGDEISFEKAPLENIASDGELMAYRHNGFWYAMDTLKNRMDLEDMWSSKKAPWKIWD